MTRKVAQIVSELSVMMQQWSGLEAIVLGEDADISTYDPYFCIDLDVYFRATLPPSNDRQQGFGDPAVFETSPSYPIDTFLVGDFPVRIVYAEISRIDLILQRVKNHAWVLHESGTNLFYRIQNGKILHTKSDWLEHTRADLAQTFAPSWDAILDASRRAMAHSTRDIGAAVLRSDGLLLLTASAGFVRSVCTHIFALNQKFEPSPRTVQGKIAQLKNLPEGFLGRLESFLRQDDEITPEKKRELAELITKSLI